MTVLPTPRDRQIAELCSRVPCAHCGHPESPLGSHDCRRELSGRRGFSPPPETIVDESGYVWELEAEPRGATYSSRPMTEPPPSWEQKQKPAPDSWWEHRQTNASTSASVDWRVETRSP